MVSQKLAKNVDRGLWVEYGAPEDSYSAAVCEVQDVDGVTYVISFHKGDMPAFKSESYDSLEALEKRMREIEPDMCKWRVR
ncbi:MAG: hypothetical protein D6706_18470 [Chloroflexi bacterium]|nr:MAG: hypothetical protein D6706_18470 [Chloroflexota bacterium]